MVSPNHSYDAKHDLKWLVDCTRTGSLLKCFPELSRDTVDNPFNREDDFCVMSPIENPLSAPSCALQH